MSSGGYGQPPYGGPQYGQPGYGPPPQGQPGYGAPGYGAAGYGAPGYGASQYGRPGYGSGYGGYGPQRQSFGIVGAALAALGAVALIVAFTATHWYKDSGDSSFSKVKDQVDAYDKVGAATGVAKAYFGWLAWVLLVAVVLVAVAANLPSPAAVALRIIGAVIGAAGILLTFLAIKLVDGSKVPGGNAPDYSDYLKHTGPAFYLALGGFLLAAVGALIGPRRV